MEDGRITRVKVPGNGRFTLGGSSGRTELRIYANKSDKDYVVALRDGVVSCRRADIEIENEPLPGKKPWHAPSTITATPPYELSRAEIDDLALRIVVGADLTKAET